jgi:acetoacetate decarboxylase
MSSRGRLGQNFAKANNFLEKIAPNGARKTPIREMVNNFDNLGTNMLENAWYTPAAIDGNTRLGRAVTNLKNHAR